MRPRLRRVTLISLITVGHTDCHPIIGEEIIQCKTILMGVVTSTFNLTSSFRDLGGVKSLPRQKKTPSVPCKVDSEAVRSRPTTRRQAKRKGISGSGAPGLRQVMGGTSAKERLSQRSTVRMRVKAISHRMKRFPAQNWVTDRLGLGQPRKKLQFVVSRKSNGLCHSRAFRRDCHSGHPRSFVPGSLPDMRQRQRYRCRVAAEAQ